MILTQAQAKVVHNAFVTLDGVSANSGTAYALAGLSFDTKFDFKASIKLPWSSRYFKVPPRAPYGQTPKMGVLHPALYHAFAAAFNAAKP